MHFSFFTSTAITGVKLPSENLIRYRLQALDEIGRVREPFRLRALGFVFLLEALHNRGIFLRRRLLSGQRFFTDVNLCRGRDDRRDLLHVDPA